MTTIGQTNNDKKLNHPIHRYLFHTQFWIRQKTTLHAQYELNLSEIELQATALIN